ncbi:vestitone reductase-like [Solanum tuberosum]|uniref:Dihydroflavonol 4-reductase n=1 Tax=Solanum tuberosum TaxID=4113 RepID=M1C6S7_SOLTU|nr:PREDICTED: vestitone reductase-like [Solanum tuberosum]
MEKINEKGIVCVTGGTGYVTSWLIMRLLQSGYYVNTTINNNMDEERASFLKKLPNASQKLKIFTTNHEDHASYNPAIEGCNGVIIGHSVDFEDKYDDEERKIQRSIDGILGILKACLDSKTIKRVIYTSSDGTIGFIEGGPNVVDESFWSDIDFIKKMNPLGAFYCISKTLIEKEALNFAHKNGLDLVCVNHAWVFGPFVTPQCPIIVLHNMAMILGNWTNIEYDSGVIALVHVDDVARTHIFLLESTKVKGSCLKVTKAFKCPCPCSKKLLDVGFKYKYSLEDMYDGAIASCKQIGLL